MTMILIGRSPDDAGDPKICAQPWLRARFRRGGCRVFSKGQGAQRKGARVVDEAPAE
jgi:hypothetical protein